MEFIPVDRFTWCLTNFPVQLLGLGIVDQLVVSQIDVIPEQFVDCADDPRQFVQAYLIVPI